MKTYLYFSTMPEALVASMLPPKEFGQYLAVGTKKRARGQAMFFDLAPDFESDAFDLSSVPKRCVPHPDGRPKHSVYLAIYRVLERLPLDALRSLWLVTPDGRVLELKPSSSLPSSFPCKYHLYKEICPVHPLIVSTLPPDRFCRFITDPSRPIYVPRLCFVDLDLGGLADDPQNGEAANLPYREIDHLRDCLLELDDEKHTKTVDRIHGTEFPARCVKSGFFVGGGDEVLYYPFPSREELETTYYEWWRSANV